MGMGRSSTTESKDGVLSTDSPLSNDGDDFGGSSSGGVALKKGPWTSAEDSILIDYVKKHGEGNWNAVQKHSGLARCGKSCRLRWANHLRPNLKKGAFTADEERLIIELHAKMGNKWARMAAHLPGRTDNEIKNYWNTRIKRRQRAGLPLYPPELCLHALPENQQPPGIYNGDKGYHNILQRNGYETPDGIYDSLNSLPYRPGFPDLTTNCFGSPQFYRFVPQSMGMAENEQEPDEPMSDYRGSAVNEAPQLDWTQTDSCVNKMSQSSFGPCPFEPDYTKKLLSFEVNQDNSYFVSFSAPKHFSGAQESELPSLQYQETCLGVWDPAPESLDSFEPPLSEPLPSHCPPGSSGLLEDLLYEAKALRKSENQSSDWATPSNMCHADMTGLKDYPQPSSPSGNSIGSTPDRRTPDTIRSSLEKNLPACLVKSEVFDQYWIPNGERKKPVDCYRPDAILGSCWVEQSASQSKQQNDSIAAIFLGNNSGIELKNTSASASNRGFSSCTWNNMPAVCQMPEIP